MDPFTMALIGGAGSLLGGGMQLGGSLISSARQPDYEKIAEENRKSQERENELQRNFGRELLSISRPQISAEDLGQLLFAQNEQGFNQQSDRGLAQVLANNMRQGAPSSAGEITTRFNQAAGAGRGDRLAQSRLQGILGTLPGAAAQASAAGLFRTQAPQTSNFTPSQNIGDQLAAFGYALPGMTNNFLDMFRQAGGTNTTNRNTGGFGGMNAGFLSQ